MARPKPRGVNFPMNCEGVITLALFANIKKVVILDFKTLILLTLFANIKKVVIFYFKTLILLALFANIKKVLLPL
jgi:hypothetical protein